MYCIDYLYNALTLSAQRSSPKTGGAGEVVGLIASKITPKNSTTTRV